MTRHVKHGGKDALIADATLAKLAFDHFLAEQLCIRLREGGRRGAEAVATGGGVLGMRHEHLGLLESLPADDVDTKGAVFIAQGDNGNIGA